MPSIVNVLRRFTNQYCLYWQKVGSDDKGKPLFLNKTAPVELAVRWEDKWMEGITYDDRKVMFKGYMLSATPLLPGSLVFLGGNIAGSAVLAWEALPTYPAIPSIGQGAREVLLLKTTPDIKALGDVYEAYL